MSAQEDTFISHLIELRDRLLRAVVAVVAVFVCLMPWAGDIYDILAHPVMQALPEGTRMIATGVVTPFFVPMKVTLLVAFVIALPFVLYQAWCFIAPGLYASAWACRWWWGAPSCSWRGWPSAASCVRDGVQVHRPVFAQEHHPCAGHRAMPGLRGCPCSWPSASPSRCRCS